MQRLFHVSEESSIRRFHPRRSPAGSTFFENVVWAVDEPHLPNYLLPRDCPRVTYRLSPGTSEEDRARFFTGQSSHVVAIGSEWVARAANQILFVYDLPVDSFRLLDVSAGYWISPAAVEPTGVTELRQPLVALVSREVELRVVPDLQELREAVVQSTVDFSIIRMRNASPVSNDPVD